MKPCVKKFGGSLLRSDSDFLVVANYLSKFYNQGLPLIVVVSAQYGMTDKLIQQAMRYSPCQGEAYELLLSLGEQQSCALLSLALQSLGIPSEVFCGYRVGIHKTSKDNFEVDVDMYWRAVKQSIAIIGGFQVMNEKSQLLNLGRGGSDLTALLIASAMKFDCELVKNVPGIFNLNDQGERLDNFYKHITFKDLQRLLKLGSFVVQLQAVEFAEKKQYAFTVMDIHGCGTKVGGCVCSTFRDSQNKFLPASYVDTLTQVAL